MGEPLTVHLDDDVYDAMLDEHNRTGRSKSSIVNKAAKQGFDEKQTTLSDSVIPVFGQALFIVGWVIAFFSATLLSGAGVSLIGLAMMLGAKIDEHRKNGSETLGEAIRRSVGI